MAKGNHAISLTLLFVVNTLRDQLHDFQFHEETPVDAIIATQPMDAVVQELESMLLTNDSEVIPRVLTFIRDAALYDHPFRKAFRAQLGSSTIWDVFRSLLRAPNYWVRSNTIYTVGKLTYREKSSLLSEAFPYFMTKDPINLRALFFELVWLENEWNWSLLHEVATADHYLARWSLCSIVSDYQDAPDTQRRFSEILSGLSRDLNVRVAAEAHFRLERIQIKLRPKLPKPEWRTEIKRIAKLEPKLTFDRATSAFMLGREDYCLGDFDDFMKETI